MHRKLTRMDGKINRRERRARREKNIGNNSAVSACSAVKSNRASGLTLSEVVVASALLIIAIVPMLQALTTANLNTAGIERKTHSLILAQAKLDEIKAKSVYHYADSYIESSVPFDPPDGLYLRNVTDDSDTNLRTITVSVGYNHNGDSDLDPDEIEITLTTLIARRWTDI